MKIYFTAAISLKDKYGENYTKIINLLKGMGHDVIHEHISNIEMSDIHKATEKEQKEYYIKVQNWIKKADAVVAELSFPSTLNVGHEVSTAIELNKPVIGLYLKDKASSFFKGIQNERFLYSQYSIDNLNEVIEESLDYASSQQDTRFNFFVSPKHINFLDWIAQNKKIPRSVYLRRLIEKEMSNDDQYNSQ